MYAIIDARAPRGCLDGLRARGFKTILLPGDDRLAAPVSGHADMLLYVGDRIFCRREYYDIAERELDAIARLSGLSVELTDEKGREKYPQDVLFNAVRFGESLFCRADATSRSLREYAERVGLEIVNVRQGYTKCSVCAVNDGAAITADVGLAAALEGRGVEVLRVEPGHVTLPGYDSGFIGGATGVFGDSVYFCGSIEKHPNGKEIAAFCEKHGKRAVSLSDEKLYDVGSIFFFE